MCNGTCETCKNPETEMSLEEITAHRIASIEQRIAADTAELKRLKRVQKLLTPAPTKEPETPAEPAITMELGTGKVKAE